MPERAKRRPEAARQADFTATLDACDRLSNQVWERLEAAGYSRSRTFDAAVASRHGESPDYGRLAEQLHDVQVQLAHASAEVRDIRSRNEPKADLSGLSFDECADVLKALACFPQAEFAAYGVGSGPFYSIINPLWLQAMDHLSSLDPKRADRVIDSAISAGARKLKAGEARLGRKNNPKSAA